jgi:hypothetical protein
MNAQRGIAARWGNGGSVRTDYAVLAGSLVLAIIALCWLLFVGAEDSCQAFPVTC